MALMFPIVLLPGKNMRGAYLSARHRIKTAIGPRGTAFLRRLLPRLEPVQSCPYEPVTYARHPLIRGKELQGSFAFSTGASCTNPHIASLLVESFRRCEVHTPNIGAAPGVDIWQSLIEHNHEEIIRLIQSGD